MVVRAWNPNTLEVEAGGSGVQDHILCYIVRPASLAQQNEKEGEIERAREGGGKQPSRLAGAWFCLVALVDFPAFLPSPGDTQPVVLQRQGWIDTVCPAAP